MIRIKFQSRNLATGELLPEEASVGSLATAREELKELIERFNEEEKRRYGDDAQLRELVAVDTDQKGKLQHDWHKKSLCGERNKRGRIVDIWQCRGCGIRREVTTLGGVPRGGDCFPERTCVVCCKVFANAANLRRHMQRKEAG